MTNENKTEPVQPVVTVGYERTSDVHLAFSKYGYFLTVAQALDLMDAPLSELGKRSLELWHAWDNPMKGTCPYQVDMADQVAEFSSAGREIDALEVVASVEASVAAAGVEVVSATVGISDEELAKRMADCNCGCKEETHMGADALLCELLTSLGFPKTVEAFEALPKWYA